MEGNGHESAFHSQRKIVWAWREGYMGEESEEYPTDDWDE